LWRHTLPRGRMHRRWAQSWGTAGLRAVLLCAAAAAGAQDVHVRVVAGSTNGADPVVFGTVQYAMDHAPRPGPGGRLIVQIGAGTYAERVMVTANRPRTTFLGDPKAPSSVVITAAQNAKSAGGTFFSATVDVEAPGFIADGITFENSAGATGQAVAIAVRSDRAIFKHCRFLGDQDTLFADFGRQYFVDSYIAGGVDFIFGNAAAVFDHVEIHEKRAGYLTAQSRTSPTQTTGYVITDSTVTADDLNGRFFFLGRPWREYSRVVVMHTALPAALAAGGWSPWRAGEQPTLTDYAEFENTGAGAATSGRVSWSRQLSARETERFAPAVFLRGDDGWMPEAEAARLP
jgi:pectinesterase